MTQPEKVLHLGAHRTGTTALQAALDAAEDPLRAQGIVALTPPRPTKRAGATLRDVVRETARLKGGAAGPRYWPARRGLRRQLDALVAERTRGGVPLQRLILSEEMLLGPAFAPDGKALYPDAHRRLAAFRRVCLDRVSEVHLTLRSYESFLVSVYAMRAVYVGGLPSFSTVEASLVGIAFGWPDLVHTIRGVFPEARIVLSLFECTALTDRLQALVGPRTIAFPGAASLHMNRAPTLEAIEHVTALGRRPDDPDAVVARFAEGTAFDPLDDARKESLKARYCADVASLRERDDIRFLDGGRNRQ